jgi:hypothetical protein
MSGSKVKRNISADDLGETESSDREAQEQTDSRRRFADSLKSKSRKIKLDRRVAEEDRRTGGSTEYKGPARRKILDRRESRKDRRDEG